jgi:hypothetical protein
MAKDQYPRYPHKVGFTQEARKQFERAAVLLDLKDWTEAIDSGMYMITDAAESRANGKAAVVFCKPELAASIENNPAFFEALCQEGVIEWLMPFVMGKTATSPEESQ